MSGQSSPRVTSPVRVSARHHGHHHLPHSSHHHHPSITAQVSSTLHRRGRSRDERTSSTMVAQQQVAPRASLEVPRSEGVTPGTLSPNQSRRGSFSITPGAVPAPTATVVPPVNKEEELLRREREKAEARTTCEPPPPQSTPVCHMQKGTNDFLSLDTGDSNDPSST